MRTSSSKHREGIETLNSIIGLMEELAFIDKQNPQGFKQALYNTVESLEASFKGDGKVLAHFDTKLTHITTALSGIIDMLDYEQVQVINLLNHNFFGINSKAYLNMIDNMRRECTVHKVKIEDLDILMSAVEQHSEKTTIEYRVHLLIFILSTLKKYATVSVLARFIESQTHLALTRMTTM